MEITLKEHKRHQLEGLSKLLLSASFRNLEDPREKVLALKFTHGVSGADIITVTGYSSTSVYRWCANPEKEFHIGRKPYLHADDWEELFERLIPQAAFEHNAMDFPTIAEKVQPTKSHGRHI